MSTNINLLLTLLLMGFLTRDLDFLFFGAAGGAREQRLGGVCSIVFVCYYQY
jgi:hypothetical protein